MLPAVANSPRMPPSKAVVRIVRFLRHLTLRSRGLAEWARAVHTNVQAGQLTNLYGRPFGPLAGADGPQYGGHAVRRSRTPRSARAPVTTWWDKPIAPPAPPPPALQPSEKQDGATSERFQHTTRQSAMEYHASLLEERMLLAATKRRRNELVAPVTEAARTTRGSQRSLSTRSSQDKSPWAPARPDPWSVAIEDRTLELRALHQESLRDFSRSNTAIQQWILDKQAELKKPQGQGQDQMDRVLLLLATGREAVQRAGGGDANLKDIKDALEGQKTRRRIDSRWTKKLEASHKDLQWISKCRQREKARQQDSNQRAALARADNSVNEVDLRGSAAGLQRAGPSVQSTKSLGEVDAHSPSPRAITKVDSAQEATDQQATATLSQSQETLDGAQHTIEDGQDGAPVKAPTVPSYMAPNESSRRRNDGFCRGRAIREQIASTNSVAV